MDIKSQPLAFQSEESEPTTYVSPTISVMLLELITKRSGGVGNDAEEMSGS